jgi:snurportin-1
MENDKKKQRKKSQVDQKYAELLTIPEYMVEVPEDLKENWITMPRPEGIRCLVISSKGITTSRKKNGKILAKFQSMLPDGSL